MPCQNDHLEQDVRAYLATHDQYDQNKYRNSILLSISASNSSKLVQILDEIYEKEDDPVDKNNVLKLLYEIISRTENIFGVEQTLSFLSKCLKMTICVQLSVSSVKSLLDRHMNTLHSYQSIKSIYNSLNEKKISQYPQKCRLDFLHISHYLVDLYVSGKLDEFDVEKVCDEISGEKDPRNLLVMFDLLSKMAKYVAKTAKEFEYISRTYAIYYPIHFTPPKRDTIQITPTQLKKSLLACFTSSERLGPYSMEILLDSLCSEYNLNGDFNSIVSDTLYFLKSCKSVYGSTFGKSISQLIQVIRIEFMPDKVDLVTDFANTSGANGADATVDLDLVEIRKVGESCYKNWNYIDPKVKLYGEILKLFINSVHNLEDSEMVEFLLCIRKDLNSNNSIGYLLEILCENSSTHCKIIDHVVLPLIQQLDTDTGSELDILIMFILPKMLIHFNNSKIDCELVLNLLRLGDNVKYLKLLKLVSCIVNELIVGKFLDYIINVLFHESLSRSHILYFQILNCIYKCHTTASLKVIETLCSYTNQYIHTIHNDVQHYLETISYMDSNDKGVNISTELVGLFEHTVKSYSKLNSCPELTKLMKNIILTSIESLNLMIDFNELDCELLELCINYANLITLFFEFLWPQVIFEVCDEMKLSVYFEKLLNYYLKSFTSCELSNSVLHFITSKVPRILNYLMRAGEYKMEQDLIFDYQFLNLYFNNFNSIQLFNCGSDALKLMNIEAYMIANDYFMLERLKSFKYFNGSVLVKYVLNNYKFEFNLLIKQIKLLSDYNVNDVEYDDLFLLIYPMSLNNVNPILKHQLIDIRKAFIGTESKNGEFGVNLLEYIIQLFDERNNMLPDYNDSNLETRTFSKLELYISILSLTLQYLGLSNIVQWMGLILKDMNNVMDKMSGDVYETEVKEYVEWCFNKYLLYLQSLILLILNNLNKSKYDSDTHNGLVSLLSTFLNTIIYKLIAIYKANKVPFSRILTILTIHGLFTSKYIEVDVEMKKKVIKLSNEFLGDFNKKVRHISVFCRQQWINSLHQ